MPMLASVISLARLGFLYVWGCGGFVFNSFVRHICACTLWAPFPNLSTGTVLVPTYDKGMHGVLEGNRQKMRCDINWINVK